MLIHGRGCVVGDQQSSPLHEFPDLPRFATAERHRFRQNENSVGARAELAGFDLIAGNEIVLQAQIFNQFRPTVSNPVEVQADIIFVQHPVPRVHQILKQPVNLE